MTEGWALGAPEYAALFTFFSVMLIGLNWAWIDSLRPKHKLHALLRPAEQVYDTIRRSDREGWDDLDWGEFDRKLRYLSHGVKRLGLTPPPTDGPSHGILKEWLLIFLPIAKTKNMTAAKRLSRLGIIKYMKQEK